MQCAGRPVDCPRRSRAAPRHPASGRPRRTVRTRDDLAALLGSNTVRSAELPIDGTLVRGDCSHAFISVIYDSFLNGFKLKLVEMAKHGKSIISFCDLQEELVNIGFEDLPYILVGNRSELREAITHFRRKGDVSQESRREYYRKGRTISWTAFAETALGECC